MKTLRRLFGAILMGCGGFLLASTLLSLSTLFGESRAPVWLTLIVALVFGVISLVQKLAGTAQPGFTTVILLLLLIGSFLMISLGIIGYYLARIYDEVKGRPRYIISRICGREGETK